MSHHGATSLHILKGFALTKLMISQSMAFFSLARIYVCVPLCVFHVSVSILHVLENDCSFMRSVNFI